MRFSTLLLGAASVMAVAATAIDSVDSLAKRQSFTNAPFTYFEFEGYSAACGQFYNESTFAVALNPYQFGSGFPGPHCSQTITITYKERTATAEIVDECTTCPYGGLDLSTNLFSYLTSPDTLGPFYCNWSFN